MIGVKLTGGLIDDDLLDVGITRRTPADHCTEPESRYEIPEHPAWLWVHGHLSPFVLDVTRMVAALRPEKTSPHDQKKLSTDIPRIPDDLKFNPFVAGILRGTESSHDSPLEGTGFEPSVPLRKRRPWREAHGRRDAGAICSTSATTDDFRIIARRQEKVRHQPEATGDFAMEGGLVGRWQGRSSGPRRWPLQPRNPSRFRSTRACRQAATAISFWLATNGRGCHP